MNEHRSSECNELFTALAKAQADMPMAGLNASNPFFKSRYTDLAEIVRVSRPCLTKNNLAVIQQLISKDESNYLVTVLAHSSGQFIESCMKITPAKNDIQGLGSYISYLKRYQLASIIGCVSSEELDDDGEAAMQEVRTTAPSIYISDAQVKLLEDKMRTLSPTRIKEVAAKIQSDYKIDDRRKILKKDFNDILNML